MVTSKEIEVVLVKSAKDFGYRLEMRAMGRVTGEPYYVTLVLSEEDRKLLIEELKQYE